MLFNQTQQQKKFKRLSVLFEIYCFHGNEYIYWHLLGYIKKKRKKSCTLFAMFYTTTDLL